MRWMVDASAIVYSKRIDAVLSFHFPDISRSRIAKAIRGGQVLLNGTMPKPKTEVSVGDIIDLDESALKIPEVLPENLPVEIRYEDEYIAVLKKPYGLVVHPTESVRSGTLVNRLLYHFSHLSDLGGQERPGIVHRLDADTTGLIVVAKTNCAHEALADQFRNHSVEKRYLAFCEGYTAWDRHVVQLPIARDPNHREKMSVSVEGRAAHSVFTTLFTSNRASLVEVQIHTGRTHQIRVHLQALSHPLIGDGRYGRKKSSFSVRHQLLHAALLAFSHPISGERLCFVTCPDSIFMEFAHVIGAEHELMAWFSKYNNE